MLFYIVELQKLLSAVYPETIKHYKYVQNLHSFKNTLVTYFYLK